MPTNKKQNVSSMETDSENDSDESNAEAYAGNEEIQVDFEGRNPIDIDFHGIRQLLQQLFLKAHINISEMSELLIAQNYIGSVVTQSEDDDEDGDNDDEDDGMYESNMIFGITSALNITAKKDISCIQELTTHLLERADRIGTESSLFIKNILCGEQQIGFLINERFINIPAQISLPLMENLYKEIKRANDKKMPFSFDYYVMIVKFYRKKAKKNKPSEDIYSNEEEEVICTEALHSFEYSVESETDSGMSGDWLEGDSVLTPFRKVVLFEANKLPHLILTIKDFINK